KIPDGGAEQRIARNQRIPHQEIQAARLFRGVLQFLLSWGAQAERGNLQARARDHAARARRVHPDRRSRIESRVRAGIGNEHDPVQEFGAASRGPCAVWSHTKWQRALILWGKTS